MTVVAFGQHCVNIVTVSVIVRQHGSNSVTTLKQHCVNIVSVFVVPALFTICFNVETPPLPSIIIMSSAFIFLGNK